MPKHQSAPVGTMRRNGAEVESKKPEVTQGKRLELRAAPRVSPRPSALQRPILGPMARPSGRYRGPMREISHDPVGVGGAQWGTSKGVASNPVGAVLSKLRKLVGRICVPVSAPTDVVMLVGTWMAVVVAVTLVAATAVAIVTTREISALSDTDRLTSLYRGGPTWQPKNHTRSANDPMFPSASGRPKIKVARHPRQCHQRHSA